MQCVNRLPTGYNQGELRCFIIANSNLQIFVYYQVRLQTMPLPAAGQPPKYKGIIDCTVKTFSREGVRGFYRGISAPLIGVTPIYAVDFAVYAAGKRLFQTDEHVKLTYSQIFMAGVGAGICSALVTVPTDRIKVLLQTQPVTGPTMYNGLIDTALKLYRQGGMRSLFKGTCACVLRGECGMIFICTYLTTLFLTDSPTGIYFVVYEGLQDLARQHATSGSITPTSTIFSGGMAGIAFWSLAVPFDVLKSRLQSG